MAYVNIIMMSTIIDPAVGCLNPTKLSLRLDLWSIPEYRYAATVILAVVRHRDSKRNAVDLVL